MVHRRPFRVLALDGGGMRGLYSAAVLDSIARHFAAMRDTDRLDIGAGFDLITATSTGSILGSALALGIGPTDVIQFYRSTGPRVFRRPIPDSPGRFLTWALRHVNRAGHNDSALRDALVEMFRDATLASVYSDRGIALCVPAVNMATGRSMVFKTPHEERFTRDRDIKLADVCLATSAAPIYLPLAVLEQPHDPDHLLTLADGGLWANNPVLIGLIESLNLAPADQSIHILSISTCPPPQGEVGTKQKRSWGLIQWGAGTTALKLALESQSWGYHYMATRLATALRTVDRDIHVVRVPHTTPSKHQATYVGLDKATTESIQILIDLGRQDGDLDQSLANWFTGEAAEVVTGMFMGMPDASDALSKDRRECARANRGIFVGEGLLLIDESDGGAGFLIQGHSPQTGDVFEFTVADLPTRGEVRWVVQLGDGTWRFGIETFLES